MKKKFLGIAVLALAALTLAACGSTKKATTDSTKASTTKLETLTVGASPSPHAEILEHVKPILKKEGIDLKIQEFSDYVLPNTALVAGDIDANYFQHVPFLNKFDKENGDVLVNAGSIHIEPMGIYSKTVKDIKDLKDGATLIISTNTPDYGRILTILADAGVLTLKSGVDAETATLDDIAENPKNLKIKNDIAPEMLFSAYDNEEADLVAINANYAYTNGLNPTKDALLADGEGSPYANLIAVKKENKDDPRVKKLVEALRSKEVQDWILKKWDGSVKPVSEN